MLNLLFNAPQNYAWVLNYGRRLLEEETKDTEKKRTEHQINTRIYNNAFCGLLLTGYPFEIIPINDQIFLQLMIDSIPFQCPSNTVSNILRQEYNTIVKSKMDTYNKTNSGKVAQDKSDKPPVGMSEQKAAPVSMLEIKPKEDIALTAKEDPAKEENAVTEFLPMAEMSQKGTAFTQNNLSSLQNEEMIDDTSIMISPQKQMEQMRKSKEQGTFNHSIMAVPDLEDIIFAPIITHKKMVEIGDEPIKPYTKTEGGRQDVEEEITKTEKEAQKADTPALEMIDKKQEIGNSPSIETIIEDTKTQYGPISADSVNSQAADPVKDASSASSLEFKTLLDNGDVGIANKQGDLKEQQPNKQEKYQEETKKMSVSEPTTSEMPEHPSKRMFQPKAQRFVHKSVSPTGRESAITEDSTGQVSAKEKRGFLSTLFGGDGKKTEVAPLTPAVNHPSVRTDLPLTETVKDDVRSQAEEKSVAEGAKMESYNHDGGKLFSHIHQVILKKQFGSSSTGPYRFIFWPLRIIEMQSKKNWADFLVHVTDQNGNETLLCTDGAYKELIVKVDGKEFNIYGTWTNGIFDSHVSLYGKTASIYTIEEKVYKEEPVEAEHDGFLDQFRLERKGQPKHFIVPFKRNNRGELNIPIVGCVELGGKRYPLERREENTLRYRYNGSEKVIRGHWEKGVFQFSVDDANCFIWEEHNE